MQIRLDPDGTNLQPDKRVDTSKITNVLIFKDGYYYLTLKRQMETEVLACNCKAEKEEHYHLRQDGNDVYQVIPDEWRINNGFEFASDAYAYLAHLKDNTPKTTEPEE